MKILQVYWVYLAVKHHKPKWNSENYIAFLQKEASMFLKNLPFNEKKLI
jgi:hypothetical protein